MITVEEAAKKAFGYTAEMETIARDDASIDAFLSDSDVAVESARHDDAISAWVIGVGFVRPWERQRSRFTELAGRPEGLGRRTTKFVVISDETGEMLRYE